MPGYPRHEIKARILLRLQRLSDFHQEIESNTVEIRRYHKACEMALDALENHSAIKHPQQMHYRDSAIEALREVLGGKECGRRKVCERTADGYCARCHEGMY